MTIGTKSDDEVKELLSKWLTPAQPISTRDRLFGRTGKLQQIERALDSPGKHVFIYGDRGVGKTSLAKTAAFEAQPTSQDLVMVSFGQDVGFYEAVQDAARLLHPNAQYTDRSDREGSIQLGLGVVSGSLKQNLSKGIIPKITTINEAVEVLGELKKFHPTDSMIIVFDEFDQVTHVEDRKRMADFIKALSDREVAVKLVICGIGSSLEDLIGVHLSTDRYIAPIELKVISQDARWDILNSAATHLGIEIPRETVIRIGQISDGFPYYIHLVGEKIIWEMQDDPTVVHVCTLEHYHAGLRAGLKEAQTSLRKRYELATRKYKNTRDYEEALWAAAEGKLFERAIGDIYAAYEWISAELGKDPISRKTFYQRMARLKKPTHGEILEMTHLGWYRFRDNVIRGFVRMSAEDAGVHLGVDHNYAVRPRTGDTI